MRYGKARAQSLWPVLLGLNPPATTPINRSFERAFRPLAIH